MQADHPLTHQVHLRRGADRGPAIAALAESCGGRVGLEGVLADLNRVARPTAALGTAAVAAWGWNAADQDSPRWWPQGITSSGDAWPDGTAYGREVLITSAYARRLPGESREEHPGARLTVTDLSDPRRLRYRHVLLVSVDLDDDGQVRVRPLPVHAGGLAWWGDHVSVAATGKGLVTVDLRDIVATPTPAQTFGYHYLAPVRWRDAAVTAEGAEPFRYSFVAVGHSDGARGRLLVGEYGREGASTRLAAYRVEDGLLHREADGIARPVAGEDGVAGMQGVVAVGGRVVVSTSDGPRRRGHLWVRRGAAWRRHARVLPVGPEDLCYWPQQDRLWTLSEYPGSRLVVALDPHRFLD